LKSECEYEPKIWSESFVVWADGHWDFFVYCYRLCGINVKNRSVKLTFRFNLLKKFCLGYLSVATRFPYISGVLGRHNLGMSDSQDAHGIVRLLWYLETILLLRQDCGLFFLSSV
jgi:hypothetical protein